MSSGDVNSLPLGYNHACMLSHFKLCPILCDPMDCVCCDPMDQAPLSMGFFGQEY